MAAHRCSRLAYRLLLRTYPREFRERFAADLQADFARLLERDGTLAAWRRLFVDLARSVPLTAGDALAEGERRARIAGPILPRGESIMRSVLFDLRHALRGLFKAPGFTIVTTATLALAIGANTATFSLVNAVLLRPIGYHDPGRLMLVFEAIPESGIERFGVAPADYVDLAAYQQSFESMAAYRTRSVELSGGADPEQVAVAEVSTSLFDVLGVGAGLGRAFRAGDPDDEAAVAVISDRLSQRRFGGRSPIGERLVLDRRAFTVVGVMPPQFEFPRRGAALNAEPADVWLPLVFNPFERQARGMMYNNSVIARLRPGVSPAQAAADTSALARRIQDNYPASLRSAFTLTIGVTPLADEITGPVRRPLLILLGAVGIVLLVACANLASIVLSRSVARQRDIGVRAALGAGRLRLFQILLLEGLLLAAAGGAVGLVLGYWVLRGIPHVVATAVPGATDIAVDWRVLVFTSAVSLGCAVLFALVPLTGGLGRNLHDLLREGSGRATGSRTEQRVQAVMVVTSVALAFVLLVSAGLLMRSFTRLIAADAGPPADNVLTLEVRLPPGGYRDAARIRSFYGSLHERLLASAGVRAASLSTDLPLDGDGERRAFTPEQGMDSGQRPALAVTWVHGDFFSTFGIPLVRGRYFSTDEQRSNRSVAIVSARLADRYWPGEDPVGKRFKWGLADSPAPWQVVIGVAGDMVDGPPGSEPPTHIYVPYAEIPDAQLAAPLAGLFRRFIIAVRAETNPRALAGIVRGAVAALDPALATAQVRPFTELRHDRVAPQRFSTIVLSAFAGGTLLLAAIGLYGTLAFSISQRRREIGVRVALGAQRRDVLRSVVGRGMMLVAGGLVLGALGALGATRLLAAVLFDTRPHDPLVFGTVPIVLGAVGLIACYLPARGAADVDPLIAMRVD